jgi:hypothetical protein
VYLQGLFIDGLDRGEKSRSEVSRITHNMRGKYSEKPQSATERTRELRLEMNVRATLRDGRGPWHYEGVDYIMPIMWSVQGEWPNNDKHPQAIRAFRLQPIFGRVV